MKEHCNIDPSEFWDMPVAVRHWWMKRKVQEEKSKNKKGDDGGGDAPIPTFLRK